MSFWGGFARGFGAQLDREQRKKEFAETLKQRRIETLMTVRASREANNDFDSGPAAELFTFSETPEPEEVVAPGVPLAATEEPAEAPQEVPEGEGLMERPKVSTDLPEAPEAPTLPGQAPAPKARDNKPEPGMDAYSAALVHMGADKAQVAEIMARGGKGAVKYVYDTLIKHRGNTPYSTAELDEALGSLIISVEKGGTVDDVKLWRELYPEGGELTEADLSYLEATRGTPKPKIDMVMPWFDTNVRKDSKPLSITEKETISDSLVSRLLPALHREVRSLREGITNGEVDPDYAAKRIEEIETRAIPMLKDNNDVETAMMYLSPEAGLKIFTPYFEQYPELLEDKVFLGGGLGPFADLYKSGGITESVSTEGATSSPEKVKASDIKMGFANEQDLQRAIAAGVVGPGDAVQVGNQFFRLN